MRLLDVCLSLDCLCVPNNVKFVFDACLTDMQNKALRHFLDNGPHGYWIWDVQKDILEWSDKTLIMTLGDNAIAPKTISEFREMIHPLDRDRVVQAVDNHLKYNTAYKDIKMRLRTSSGDYSQFISTGYTLRDHNNRACLFVGSICDISREEIGKKLLEQSERKYSFLFYEMSEAAILADVESGIILEANRGAETLFGRTRADLIGSHQSSLHPASFASEAKALFRQHILSLITNKKDAVNAPIVRADGVSQLVEINSSLIDCDGTLCILGLFRKQSNKTIN
jgi:PAS domain S-box-containing protein